MVTEEQAIVPESVYADYEADLIDDGVPPNQARASRRALERIVDRFLLVMASKSDLDDMRAEIAELRERLTRLEERVRILTWVVGLGAVGMMGMMGAILARL